MLTQNTAPKDPHRKLRNAKRRCERLLCRCRQSHEEEKRIKRRDRERRMRKQGWADIEHDVGVQKASQSWASSMRIRQDLAS